MSGSNTENKKSFFTKMSPPKEVGTLNKTTLPFRTTQIIDPNDNILGAVEINGGNYFVANKKDKLTDVCLIPVHKDLTRVAQFIKDIKTKATEKQNGGKTLKRKNQRPKRRNKTAKQI